MPLFEGFLLETIQLPEGKLRLRRAGNGPPVICLHGNPQTHMMWHAVAPKLAEQFTVYCPDLRGYGVSPKPGLTEDHAPYSKRAMASDVIALMDHFGIERAALVTHDRGARVGHRFALDHPGRIEKLAVMDIIPTLEHFERADMAFAMAYYHWFFLAQPHPVPDGMIAENPIGWFEKHIGFGTRIEGGFHPDALADYRQAVLDPEVIRGICEDYRAAARIDLEHDRISREAGHKIACPLLALWGDKGIIGKFYKPLDVWRGYAASTVQGNAVPSGHFLPEEAPKEVLSALLPFLAT